MTAPADRALAVYSAEASRTTSRLRLGLLAVVALLAVLDPTRVEGPAFWGVFAAYGVFELGWLVVVTRRPAGRVLVDYNQNAWGRTLASVYSVRPVPEASVSAPITWEEVEAGLSISELTMDTVPERVAKTGDLYAPLLRERARCRLEALE